MYYLKLDNLLNSMINFELTDIYAGYNNETILSGINLIIEDGIFVIMGPSGSGKSTLLKLLNRLINPTSGRIKYKNKPITDYPIRELRRKVGMVFQKPVLFEGTVDKNIKIANKNVTDDESEELLKQVALTNDYIDRSDQQLSVGEAQRVCLARTLSTKPEVLLLDEPTSALDPTSTMKIERLLVNISNKISVVWVTHHVEQALRIGGQVAMIFNGKIHWQGITDELMQSEDRIIKKFISGELK
jgi:putative ABC transport system ATP-binding protein